MGASQSYYDIPMYGMGTNATDYAAYMQYGATSNSASSLNKPAVGADKKVNAQAYNVRCLKGNTTK